MAKPAIKVHSAQGFQSAELVGTVTVGPETAARLSKELGREVKVGETFDLGTLAYYHKNPLVRLWRSFRRSRGAQHLFSKAVNS